MATALGKMSLDELYDTGKSTPGVLRYIRELEDFRQIQPRYCGLCPAPCKGKSPSLVGKWKNGKEEENPVVVLLPHRYLDETRGGFVAKTGEESEKRIINMLSQLIDHPVLFLPAYICKQDNYNVKNNVIKHCSMYIKEKIRAIQPRAILACGPNSVSALGLKAGRGDTLKWEGIPTVVTYDPRILFMLRQNSSGDQWGPDYLAVLTRDARKVNRICQGEFPPSLEEALEEAKQQIHIVQTLEEIEAMVVVLEQEKVISCDIETSGLDPWDDGAKILTVQFGTERGDTAWVVTLWHRDWDKYDPDEAWNLIAPLLANENILKLGHNIKFDTLYIWVVKNLKMSPVEDTMLYLHSMNSGIQGEYGLKAAVSDYLWETGLAGYEDLLKLV